MEEESDGKIAFLDVLVERKGSKLSTGVYRKKTHTDRYINFQSHHHPRVKSGVISCLKNRAMRICDNEHLKKEMIHLKRTFQSEWLPIQCDFEKFASTDSSPILTGGHHNPGETNAALPAICKAHIGAHTEDLQTDWSENRVQVQRHPPGVPYEGQESQEPAIEERSCL
ncbi:MAG: hypothetical protein MJE68_12785 [Proteobacteria bacterium]|nr:hypothetical protein [Pseudomonadota bacterium]